jgi:diguanylate cyclase (GGDEF)-like protein/PAS domain S-box-containing protein
MSSRADKMSTTHRMGPTLKSTNIARWRLPNTLRVRLTMAFFVVLLAAGLLITLALAAQTARSQIEVHQRLGQYLINLMRPAVQRMLAEKDTEALNDYMGKIAGDPAIASISVSDNTGFKLFNFSGHPDPPDALTHLLIGASETPQSFSTDITTSGHVVGSLSLSLSYRPLNNRVHDVVLNGLGLSAAVLAITFLLTYSLLKRFTRPLGPLTRIAREYARGNFLPQVELIQSGSSEIQELNQAFADGSSAMQHYIQSLEKTRELLEHSEQRLRTLINNMHEVLFELDREGHITFINPAWQTITGFTIDDSLGRHMSSFVDAEASSEALSSENLPTLEARNLEILLKNAEGDSVWVMLDADAQTDSNGEFTGVIGTFGDINESVELNRMLSKYQEELYHLSVTDPLTGLYNRRHFDAQFDIMLSDHLKQGRPLCLLLIDIDGFKFINDTYGHPFGDEVLRSVSKLLRNLVRRNDYIARLAGDEFAMVLKNTNIRDATRIAHKLHDNINHAQIQLPVGHIQIQTSIGVAEAPTHGENGHELISSADVALYQGKRAGRNRVQILSPDTSKATMSIFGQGFQLRNALESGNIVPAFQPIKSLVDGEQMAYEVLARMNLDGDVIPAKDFITVAEELGLTREIDLYVIENALLNSSRSQRLFVNVDLSSFNDPSFIRRLRDLLSPACASGREITIEITERESLPITKELQKDLRELREVGCKLALDDFGSGYSTYRFLDQFQPDFLKIEGAFVQEMLHSESAFQIVTHIHELAVGFGMQTIAESIENAETLAALKKIGIHYGQGLYFGAPDFLS